MKVTKILLVAAIISVGVTSAIGFALRGDAGASATPSSSPGAYRGSEPPARFELPAFALRDQQGKLARSGDLRGKAVALTFLDTQCQETCPVVAGLVADGVRALPAAARDDVVAIAISVDPEEDTPTSVQRFLRRNRATAQLHYLVAPLTTLEPLWRRFQILSSHETGEDEVHSAPVRVYDPNGIWVSSLHAGVDLTPVNLAHDLVTALKRGKESK